MDKLVDSGINLHKCIAMGMAEGKTGDGYDGTGSRRGAGARPNVKDDLGKEEKGIGSRESSRY